MSKNNSLEDYKKLIKIKFEQEKSGQNADFCLNTSPANFKKWCCLVFESELNVNDEEIFKKFFNWNENEDKFQKIKNFDIDKFRPFQNFLIKNTKISQLESLNLIALLLNFKPRPYANFRTTIIENSDQSTNKLYSIADKNFISKPVRSNIASSKKLVNSKKYFISLVSVLVIGMLIISFFPNHKCMTWQLNHYITTDCNNVKQGSVQNNLIAYDQNDLDNFKKINVTKSTLFFKNGQPCVWYGKSFSGNCEFFTSCGLHPETGKTLKPISKYIIDKYVVE